MTNFVTYSHYNRPDTVPYDSTFMDPLLARLLSFVTPYGTEIVVKRIIQNLPFIKKYVTHEIDDNLIIEVGKSKTIFSCHMDTVSTISEVNRKNRCLDRINFMTPDPTKVENKETMHIIYGAKALFEKDKIVQYEPSTLGADDKVGVFINLKLIEQGVPGLYLFHVGEEAGGVGSKKLAAHKELFTGYKRAIAFDRANYGDIIGFQRGNRCCSTEFGKALAAKLNIYMPPKQFFKEDVHGSFTDTANYTSLVPECTNISVGYFNQHGTSEHLDVLWLKTFLLPALLKINFEDLPTHRDPNKPWSYANNNTNFYYNRGRSTYVSPTQQTWLTATKHTPIYDLPKWEPKLGFVEEAQPEVLLKTIQSYIRTCSYGPEMDKLGEYYFNCLEDRMDLEDENKALIKEIKFLRNKLGISETPPEINEKLEILKCLVTVCFSDQVELEEDYKKRLGGYILGAKTFLKTITKTTDFTKKDIKKMNRLIYQIAFYLSFDKRKDIPQITTDLILAAHEYITQHITEDGFNQPTIN